jgi:hypothetical protein
MCNQLAAVRFEEAIEYVLETTDPIVRSIATATSETNTRINAYSVRSCPSSLRHNFSQSSLISNLLSPAPAPVMRYRHLQKLSAAAASELRGFAAGWRNETLLGD